jgi:predicted negative regulator of RcsB-dependent stress response
MALELMDEHEQSELVRNWLRDNLGSIVVGVLVGIGLLVGWQQWKRWEVTQAQRAQMDYHALVEAADKGDADAATRLGEKLRREHDGTSYAALGALRDAADAVKRGDNDAAATALERARAGAKLPALKDLVTIRLARLRLGAGKADDALKLVGEVGRGGYDAMAAELRGDALVTLGRVDEARTAYDDALARIDAGSPQRQFVEMKRDDIAAPATAAAPATPEAAAPAAAAPAAPEAAKPDAPATEGSGP